MRIMATAVLAWGADVGRRGSANPRAYPSATPHLSGRYPVVWVNTRSGVYHYRGERYFGSTKRGKFMCEKAARAEGDRPTKNGQ